MDVKAYTCQWPSCGKGFKRRSDFLRHNRMHMGIRPHACTTAGCNKSFGQRSALTIHIRTHTKEQIYNCVHPGCDSRFSDSSSLIRHRRIHSVKPLLHCTHDNCKKTYTRKSSMMRHQNKHHSGPSAPASSCHSEMLTDTPLSATTPSPPPPPSYLTTTTTAVPTAMTMEVAAMEQWSWAQMGDSILWQPAIHAGAILPPTLASAAQVQASIQLQRKLLCATLTPHSLDHGFAQVCFYDYNNVNDYNWGSAGYTM